MYLSDIVPVMAGSAEFRALQAALEKGERALWVDGLTASARALLLAALRERNPSLPVLVLVPGADHADQLSEDILSFGVRDCRAYPQLDLPARGAAGGVATLPVDLAALRERLQVLEDLAAGTSAMVIAPIAAALQPVPDPVRLREHSIVLRPGGRANLDEMAQRLAEMGYERVMTLEEPGQFAVRGGILDIFPLNDTQPSRVDLFGDEVDSIRIFDVSTQRSLQSRERLLILPTATPADVDAGALVDYLAENALVVAADPRQIEARWDEFVDEHDRNAGDDGRKLGRRQLTAAIERIRRHRTLSLTLGARSIPWETAPRSFPMAAHAAGNFAGRLSAAIEAIEDWRGSGWKVVIASDRSDRLVEVLAEHQVPVTQQATDLLGAPGEHAAVEKRESGDERAGRPADPHSQSAIRNPQSGAAGRPANPKSEIRNPQSHPVACLHGALSAGFLLPWQRLAVLTDSEVFGAHKIRRPRRVAQRGQRITSLAELKEGDYVVHLHHGIGYYRGLVKQSVDGVERDYLHLEYADSQRLYVPVDQIDRVTRYIGSEEHPPAVHRIGGIEWHNAKQRAKAKVREMAGELVELYAARQAAQGHAFNPDTPWQDEMEESFIYEETPDQETAIREVKEGMEQRQPMDRLICGDVGYGKTEVAIRAAFKAVMDGKQVAVLVPTTVLAQQHFSTFSERLAAFPVTVEMLSRFRSPRDQARVARAIGQGGVDIVIGTHRLLSKDIAFRDLGLVIVDEEQRFGVAHKERLKQLRTSVDVLTLTATPIPRTLHMSLSGIRDMSVINDPPEGRTPIRTYCVEREDDLIRDAVLREIDRDGQVYFVHNRVESIESVASALERLVPNARVAVGHGQMPEDRLEKVMLDFYDRRFDVLVCTTIIESGLDIPNVNTIIIDDAPRLGLAQLYQLRGRVGRSPRQAYCYLLFDPRKAMSEVAEKRMEAIREFTELGSGFQIALRDLEIRGAGNLLGAEQHGFMLSIGFDLYCRMIADAVKELRGEEVTEFSLPSADLPVDAHLPADYIVDDRQRFNLYKRMAGTRSAADVQAMEEELRDRFGPEPAPVRMLLEVLRLRVAAAEVGVEAIATDADQVTVRLAPRSCFTEKEIARLWRHPAANGPGWRWVNLRRDRIVVELQGTPALAAAAAAVRAVSQRHVEPPAARSKRGVFTRRYP